MEIVWNANGNRGDERVEHVQVLIAGGGIGGLSAAIWCQRLGLSCLLVEKADRLGGQLRQIRNEIWDLPPRVYPHGAALLEELTLHPVIQQLQPRFDEAILSVDVQSHRITTTKSVYHADYLMIATGVSQNEIPALSGCSKVMSPWFSTTVQADRVSGHDIAVIGGGDRALESAANLSQFARRVYLLVRHQHLRARSQWAERIATLPNLQVLWETEIDTYEEGSGRVNLSLRSARPGNPSALTVDWILPRIGVHGNSAGFQSLSIFGDGYLQTDGNQQTDIPWIYALGDVSNGAAYASLSLAVGQAMKAVKHISSQIHQP